MFWAEAARRSGIRPSMAMIMERALTCPVILPRVVSGPRLASSQRRSRTWSRFGWSRCCSSTARPTAWRQVGSLLDGGPMLMHVSADTRPGFGVGGGIGVETDGFCGTTVGHGSREDQEGKGYFLVSDGVAEVVRHRWLHFLGGLEVESRQGFLSSAGGVGTQ